MTETEAMYARHSVRKYLDKPLSKEAVKALQTEIDIVNAESGLHVQLVTNEARAFDGTMAHYGKFSGVTDYFALVGKKSAELDGLCGYYGERLVLRAQQLGINSCWVALTYKKVPGAFKVEKGERLTVVIALGYGINQGAAHKSKSADEVSYCNGEAPAWFTNGVNAALLAPTAMNQQKFKLIYDDKGVKAKYGAGFYARLDLGIVKYHFEIGAGEHRVNWL